jgi:hypothetical protein
MSVAAKRAMPSKNCIKMLVTAAQRLDFWAAAR